MLRKIIFKYFENKFYTVDTNEAVQEMNENELCEKLNEMDSNFPEPGYGWQNGPDYNGAAMFVWQKVAIPS